MTAERSSGWGRLWESRWELRVKDREERMLFLKCEEYLAAVGRMEKISRFYLSYKKISEKSGHKSVDKGKNNMGVFFQLLCFCPILSILSVPSVVVLLALYTHLQHYCVPTYPPRWSPRVSAGRAAFWLSQVMPLLGWVSTTPVPKLGGVQLCQTVPTALPQSREKPSDQLPDGGTTRVRVMGPQQELWQIWTGTEHFWIPDPASSAVKAIITQSKYVTVNYFRWPALCSNHLCTYCCWSP